MGVWAVVIRCIGDGDQGCKLLRVWGMVLRLQAEEVDRITGSRCRQVSGQGI